jgi:hypothetical protein
VATLTITHNDEIRVVEDITRIVTSNGASHINATQPGCTVATFPSENAARAVAAPLMAAWFVTRIEVEVER